METDVRSYVPALRFRALTRFFDPIVAATLKEDRFRDLLVRQADVRAGHRVLDLGCGTGTLAIRLKRAHPDAVVVGLDADPDILGIARDKIAAAGVTVELHEGMAFAPPFAPASFDRVVSSLVFHHLGRTDKARTLAKVWEILKPGGELHIADWGAAQNLLMRVAFLGVQLLDGFTNTADNVNGLLPGFMEAAGLTEVREVHREMTMFGTLSLYRAVKPATAHHPGATG